MKKSISRFKRDVVLANQSASNRARVYIDPRTKYSRVIRKEANKVNELLKALEESGNINSWSSKILFNKLSSDKLNVIKGNRVDVSKLTKSKSMSQLSYIKKSLNDFTKSKTSTVKGIQQRIEDQRQLIAEQTDNIEFANELSDEEISRIYEVFNDENYKKLTESGMYDSDEIFTFITEAKEEGLGQRNFINMIKQYSEEVPDVEYRKMFRNIYDKYVKAN